MKLIPFRGKPTPVEPTTTTLRVVLFHEPREIADYGFDGAKPIPLEGSPSGYLLPWAGIEAERDRRVKGGPCELVVSGEYVDDERRRGWPILEVNPRWMEARGYSRDRILRDGKVTYTSWRSA